MYGQGSGFTLVEMVVAIAVIGVLGASAALFLRGPLASNEQIRRQTALVDEAGLLCLRLGRELAQAVPNSVALTPAGNGFVLSFNPRGAAGMTVRYRCAPNPANPDLGTVTRDNRLVARQISACRALDPQGAVYRANGGRDQLVALAFQMRSGPARLDFLQLIRVWP